MVNLKLYEQVNDNSDMMGFVFHVEITGRDLSLIGYYIVVASDFYAAADEVIKEFCPDYDKNDETYKQLCGYLELAEIVELFSSPDDADNILMDGWCELKPKVNKPYTFWCTDRNPYVVMSEINKVFSNANDIFSKGGNQDFDNCVIKSIEKNPSEIQRFLNDDSKEYLDVVMNGLSSDTQKKCEKLIRAYNGLKFT
jgi:hypothetical protein